MDYGFVAYIDESGDDGLRRVRPMHPNGSSEWFVLSAVIVRAANENAIGRWQKEIRGKLGLTQRKDIHFKDLPDYKRLVACEELATRTLRCFVVLSNKKNMVGRRITRTHPEQNYLYWWMTRLLLERVTKFCAKWSRTIYKEPRPIKMVFSQRGGMSYDRLEKYLDLLRFQSSTGNLYLNIGDLTWDVVDLGQIHVVSHKNEAGLQFADVVAGAFFQSVSLDGRDICKPEFAKKLKPRLYRGRGNQILDHGVKYMPPNLRVAQLAPQQREIFEFLGYPENGW